MSPSPSTTHSWKETLLVYFHKRVLGMFFLGFSAGLPFLLVFSTLTLWLKEEGVSRSTIGFFAWVGITYSIKVVWAPFVDRMPLPFMTRIFGQRRGWMLAAQLGIMAGLIAMSLVDPGEHIVLVAICAVWVAFCSATQDVAIDAYRIEAVDPELQGAMAGAYQVGWRIGAALVGGAMALKLAAAFDWVVSYQVMAAFVLVGLVTVLLVSEPPRAVDRSTIMQEQRVVDFLERRAHWPRHFRLIFASFIGAVVCPFVDFVSRNKRWAIVILLFIGAYRISDITMAIMANPFYVDMGFTKDQIANITKIYGLVLSIVGAIFGGFVVFRYGIMRPLLIGAILVSSTNLLFSYLATQGDDIYLLTLVISADNFSGGFAGSAFIAYLSRLTNVAYTATQYALFSSLMTLPAKFISGFSGIVVDASGYVDFFIYAALLGLPAIVLVLVLMRYLNVDKTSPGPVVI